MQPSRFFNGDQKKLIRQAVADAELDTSGEIRVHIERRCKGEVLDRGAYLFEKLGMHKTVQRNGVLFYLAVDDHKFAILGDAGINSVTPEDFWDSIKEHMAELFSQGKFSEGLKEGMPLIVVGVHYVFDGAPVVVSGQGDLTKYLGQSR